MLLRKQWRWTSECCVYVGTDWCGVLSRFHRWTSGWCVLLTASSCTCWSVWCILYITGTVCINTCNVEHCFSRRLFARNSSCWQTGRCVCVCSWWLMLLFLSDTGWPLTWKIWESQRKAREFCWWSGNSRLNTCCCNIVSRHKHDALFCIIWLDFYSLFCYF